MTSSTSDSKSVFGACCSVSFTCPDSTGDSPDGTRGVWPRAAALLVRQALEVALKTYWSAKARGLEEVSMRAQLLCLEGTLNDADAGRRARAAWNALSRASHYHAYELAPTREELLAWCDDVAVVIERTEGEWR